MFGAGDDYTIERRGQILSHLPFCFFLFLYKRYIHRLLFFFRWDVVEENPGPNMLKQEYTKPNTSVHRAREDPLEGSGGAEW